MKLHNIIRTLMIPAIAMGVTGCDNDFEYPPTVIPTSDMEQNTTIDQLKAAYWDMPADGTPVGSYAGTWFAMLGQNDKKEDIVISGQIISSDEAGNIYKNLVVRQDNGEAIMFAIDKPTGADELYVGHKYGQRIYINVTGMAIGKYSNLMEIGAPDATKYGISYLSRDIFDAQSQVDGMPTEVVPVDVTIEELMAAKNDPEQLRKWQSQLVRINGVTFVEGGKATFGDNGDYGNRVLRDASGKTISTRNSGKSEFAYQTLPTGTGDVVAIASFYNNDWQLLLNDISTERSLIGFNWEASGEGGDEPSAPVEGGDGTETDPYSVAQVLSGTGSGSSAWVTGYIVGWVEGASIADGAHFNASSTSASNVLIADAPDCTDVSQCMPVQLVYNTDARNAINLQDNPGNYGKLLTVHGSLEKYFSVNALKNTDSFKLEGEGTTPTDPDTPATPTEGVKFRPATSIESGKTYIFVYDGKVAIPIKESYSYGYLYVEDPIATEGNDIVTNAINGIVITKAADGYTLVDTYGRYMAMDETHASIQLYKEPQAGCYWSASVAANGEATFSNLMRTGFEIRWASNYKNFSVASGSTEALPILYVKVD